MTARCQQRRECHSFFGAVRGCDYQDGRKIGVVARDSTGLAVAIVGVQLCCVFTRPFCAAVILEKEAEARPAAAVTPIAIWTTAAACTGSRTTPFLEGLVAAAFPGGASGPCKRDKHVVSAQRVGQVPLQSAMDTWTTLNEPVTPNDVMREQQSTSRLTSSSLRQLSQTKMPRVTARELAQCGRKVMAGNWPYPPKLDQLTLDATDASLRRAERSANWLRVRSG